MVFNSL